MPKLDVYEIVTNKIIEALESGVVAWQKGWVVAGGPRNLNSKRPYRGLNAFLLSLSPYKSPFWCTFKGAKTAGGSVKKGEKGTIVIFWKVLKVDDPSTKSGTKNIPLLKYYTVFNAEQCEGITIPEIPVNEWDSVDAAQDMIDNMPDAPAIGFGGDSALYAPLTDSVQLPFPESFYTSTDFYVTAFHELVHSTGNIKRLGRVKDWTGHGTDPYAREELVAEMGAAMLCGAVGLEPQYENNAAYIRTWLARLKNDKKLVLQAASQAQRAADFIRGELKVEDSEESSTEQEVASVAV